MTSKQSIEPAPLKRRLRQRSIQGWSGVWRRLAILMVKVISLSLLAASCTRTTVSPQPTSTPAAEIPPVNPTPMVFSTFEPSGRYAVVGIPEGAVLTLRNPAGITGSIVEELAYDAKGITATGNVANLGSSVWMEILTSSGSRGWVNSLYMTEDVSPEQFCADVRAVMVLDQLLHSIQGQDGELLSRIVNPRRGLIIRHDWWNPELNVPAESISGIFDDPSEVEWGLLSGGEFKIKGTFKEVILPLLEDTVLNSPAPICDELVSGKTSRPALWPTEYTSMNFFSIHRPAPQGGNAFDWRTWIFAFEYIDGEPFLTLIVHFHGDV